MAGPLHLGDLDDVLTELTDATNIHPGIHLICAGIRTIAQDTTLDPDATKLLLTGLAASPDGDDVIGAIGLLIAHITDRNAALEALTDDAAKDATRAGQEAALHLTDRTLREPASHACAALDHRREPVR